MLAWVHSRDVLLKNADVEKVKEHYFSVGVDSAGECVGHSFFGTTQRTHVMKCLFQESDLLAIYDP